MEKLRSPVIAGRFNMSWNSLILAQSSVVEPLAHAADGSLTTRFRYHRLGVNEGGLGSNVNLAAPGVDCPSHCRAVWEPKRIGRRWAIKVRGCRRLPAILLFLALIAPAAAAENVDRFLSFAGITLDETETLDDVSRRFGAAALQESGEAGDYLASVCYSTDATLVYFRSHEMGGPEHRVLGFAISRPRDSFHCAPAPSALQAYGTEIGGLKLGMSAAQFKNHLGGAEWIEEQWCHYVDRQIPMSEAIRLELGLPVHGLMDEQVSVCGRFEQDALVEYEIWRVQTH